MNRTLSPLELFYSCLQEPDHKVGLARFGRIKIPKSDVFYSYALCKEKFPEQMKEVDIYLFEQMYFLKEYPQYA